MAITPEVVILKVAEVLPAGTVTVDGTCASALLLASVTVTPPAGAAPLSVTVPVLEDPPETDVREADSA